MHASKQANNNCEQAKLHNSCTIQPRVPYSEIYSMRVNANSARKRSKRPQEVKFESHHNSCFGAFVVIFRKLFYNSK